MPFLAMTDCPGRNDLRRDIGIRQRFHGDHASEQPGDDRGPGRLALPAIRASGFGPLERRASAIVSWPAPSESMDSATASISSTQTASR